MTKCKIFKSIEKSELFYRYEKRYLCKDANTQR